MRTITLALGGLGALSLVAVAAGGCELIAAVDHDLIKDGGSDPTGGGGGGTGGGATTTSMMMTTTATMMGECMTPEDCPMTGNECIVRTCNGNMCGTADAPVDTPCTMNMGVICNGMGDCVECIDDMDCTAPEACDEPTGNCVPAACMNMVLDNNETDVDCGNGAVSMCSPCMNMQMCAVGTDCVSGFCDTAPNPDVCAACTMHSQCPANQWCDNGVCSPDNSMNGTTCTVNEQCPDNFCVSTSEGSLCCDGACTGGCQGCSSTDTGGMDGACGNITAGTDPKNACMSTATNCEQDNCGAGGVCAVKSAGTNCGDGPTCVGNGLSAQDTCDAMGTCVAPMAMTCAGNFTCNAAADPDVCFAMPCTASSECATGNYCVGIMGMEAGCGTTLGTTMGACEAKKTVGGSCNCDEECVNLCVSNLCT